MLGACKYRLNLLFKRTPLSTILGRLNHLGQLAQRELGSSGYLKRHVEPLGAQYALSVTNGQLSWFANALSNVRAQVSLGADGLAIDSLAFQVARGSLSATSRFTTAMDEPLKVTLNYQEVDLASVRSPVELPTMSGQVSGQVQLSIDKRRMADWDALEAAVDGTGLAVRISDWGLGNIEYNAQKVADGSDITVHVQDAGQARRWLADGQLAPQANNGWQYKIDARGNSLDLSIPQLIRLIGTDTQLPIPLETLLVTGNLTIDGDTQVGVTSTEFNFSNITTLERDRRVWSQGSMLGRTTQEYVEIERSQFQVAGSELSASLKWHYLSPVGPRRADDLAQLQDHLNLKVNGLTINALDAWNVINLP